jgi:hypothetical protein
MATCFGHMGDNVIAEIRKELTSHRGRDMAQVVNRRHLTADGRVSAWVNSCGICGGQSGTGTGFSPSSSVLSIYHSTVTLQTHIIWGICNMLT